MLCCARQGMGVIEIHELFFSEGRESGEFSRGKDSIRASGGIVMVGNFDMDIDQQQRIGHRLPPLPLEMPNDTAFMDRLHAYLPGWDFPKPNPNEHFTDHFGLVNLRGSIDSLQNAVASIELAIEKGAETVLMPVSARKQLFELSDDMATKVNIQFYSDAQDALVKSLVE